MAKFYVKKELICKHCQQITLFENCLVKADHYGWFVCWDCLKILYLPCKGCSRFFIKNSQLLKRLHDDSGKVCTRCIEEGEYCYCRDCGLVYDKEKCKRYDSLGYHVCDDCLEANYSQCSFCEGYCRRQDVETDGQGRVRCRSCEVDYRRCYSCGDFFCLDELDCPNGDAEYCENCFEERFGYCNFCGEMFDRNSLCRYNDDSYCCSCGGERNLPLTSYHGSFIQSYGFKPLPKFYRLKGDDKLHFGVELEVENVKGDIGNSRMIEKHLIPIFGNFVYYKEDGSIRDGFELVTHPFTWRWYRNNRKMWVDGLEVLKKMGFQSYEPATCGIHVHMSKKAFSDVHLFKFLKLYGENFKFIYQISQRDDRSSGGCCQWGRRTTGERANEDQKVLLDKVKKKRGFDRYTAVNLESENTYEIRVFRGTIKIESFFKNIEFCKAAYEFSNDTGISHISVDAFKSYVGNERKVYSNLWEFMEKKGMV